MHWVEVRLIAVDLVLLALIVSILTGHIVFKDATDECVIVLVSYPLHYGTSFLKKVLGLLQ